MFANWKNDVAYVKKSLGAAYTYSLRALEAYNAQKGE